MMVEIGVPEQFVGIIPKLEESIQAAVDRFEAINQGTFQKEQNLPRRLEIVGETVAGIKLSDLDEAAHYKILLKEFERKLSASIEYAVKLFDERDFYKKGAVKEIDVLLSIKAELSKIYTLDFPDADAKIHYRNLLRKVCNDLERALGMAVTNFEQTHGKILNPMARLSALRKAGIIGSKQPMVPQFRVMPHVVASTSNDLDSLPPSVGDHKEQHRPGSPPL